MKVEELLEFLHVAEKLKSNTRHSWTADGTHESVASHSWRLALMAMLIEHDVTDVDMNKVIKMCLIHDLGEALLGDIPSFLKEEKDEIKEQDSVYEIINILPGAIHDDLYALFQEMDALSSKEARLYKALDRMEVVIQHNEADLSTWIPLEYELNLTYGEQDAEEFPFLKELRNKLKQDTLEKIKK